MDFSQMPDWVPVVACVAYMGLEYWIGKTPKLKGNSALEVLLNGLKTLCGKKPPTDHSSGK